MSLIAVSISAWPGLSQKGCLERGLVCSAGTHIRLTTRKGYEFFLTVGRDIESDGDIDMRQIPGGLYVVLRFKNLENIGNAREHLWNWIKENKYEYIGMRKGDHGWFNGFEEQINWHEGMPPNEWVFDLWVQLRE
ncbi:MAG: Bacterial transcription activator, effector binding domain [Candidatus Methanoperedens nitroreducens]|uniref:Bacterial transcription activator, effector binding domain n=1 Tax=Candidatus Methanoperedens nitratireducens TaxID=1392998 RepID=A0A0P8A9E0_9EURY|nr:GyrI-like domain-containing protein [Candidatus Methanoperedens sp. BLZ2]KAB2947242.1 MAG: GyrI-like domain-containing protein [Candidatus Methanoperedens sp.]KPQ44905.1 MAG: Bacterial transcription activator, effector binding domain [Candidatus Methanoperedens sp. BLZ1]MBZ0175381.1 GyrI-like domain-containing protein [Candidatus Methanoperedens nitroreducens]MCX9079643.1 GyrI-like domain-containing protein [Candidatus Methanoperedens sp.]